MNICLYLSKGILGKSLALSFNMCQQQVGGGGGGGFKNMKGGYNNIMMNSVSIGQ